MTILGKVSLSWGLSRIEDKGWEKLTDERNPEESLLLESSVNSCDLLKLMLFSSVLKCPNLNRMK